MTSSMLKDHTDTLRKGYPAPEFELQTANGEKFASKDLRGKKSVVFFLRGTW